MTTSIFSVYGEMLPHTSEPTGTSINSLALFMLFLAEFPTCGRRVSSTASCVSASNSLITKSQYTRSDIECLDKCRDGFPSDCSSAYRDQHGNVFSLSCHPENVFLYKLVTKTHLTFLTLQSLLATFFGKIQEHHSFQVF